MFSADHQTYLIAEPPEDLADDIISWGYDNIDDDDLHPEDGYGREAFVHLTFLSNIEDGNRHELHEAVSSVRQCECVFGKVGMFTTNARYDVVYVEVVNNEIIEMHKALDRLVMNERLFPCFIPHVTVAYLNKGCGRGLVGNRYFWGRSFAVDELTVSYNKGSNREKVKLKP